MIKLNATDFFLNNKKILIALVLIIEIMHLDERLQFFFLLFYFAKYKGLNTL